MGNSKNTPARPLTPMLQQYVEIKNKHQDSILFYRMGDFYEMFFEDATIAAPILGVQLTSRDKNSPDPIPMCGVPYHALSTYAQKVLKSGNKVAICEQVEDASTAKGLVRREVVRILTPGLVSDPDLVAPDAQNYLCSLVVAKKPKFQLCLVELLSGELWTGRAENETELLEKLIQFPPAELLMASETHRGILQKVLAYFPNCTLTVRPSYFDSSLKDSASLALKQYLNETQKIDQLDYLKEPKSLDTNQHLRIDSTSLFALEILEPATRNAEDPSLFSVVDRTSTAMGRRQLKSWLMRPETDLSKINQRLDAVGILVEKVELSESLRSLLRNFRDLERLTTKTALGLSLPRDLQAIGKILQKIPEIRKLLKSSKAPLLEELATQLHNLGPLLKKLQSLQEELPVGYRDGDLMALGHHKEVDELRSIARNAKSALLEMETKEKEKHKIPSLKVKYSRVFGYTIEVSKSHLSKVPNHYIRKQTIANGERYYTQSLKEFESKVLTAEQKLKTLEESLFLQLREMAHHQAKPLLQNARVLAELDALLSFARLSRERSYVRPTLTKKWALQIKQGRHPVLDTLVPPGSFVPNDVEFSKEQRTLLITGPNMSGKSTVMRQTALISLLAQAGCFVPAQKAKLGLIDAIFTRIGSSDNLAQGRSTFMTEMSEVSRILGQATQSSLILIDEIGRGTSTYDGLSLAWSLLEYFHDQVGAKTLFATHFHELTSLADSRPGLINMNVQVRQSEDGIVFVHKLAPGICRRSYGIEVAKLAQLPGPILRRAQQILGVLEGQSQQKRQSRSRVLSLHDNQLPLFRDASFRESRSTIE